MLGRLIKASHELAAVGITGSFAACLVLIATAPSQPLSAYAATCLGIAMLSKWLLVPSLAVVLVTGLLAMAANRAYADAGWAWLKALLGLGLFEGTLSTVAGNARRAAELSAMAVTGPGDPAQLAEVLRTERGGLWLLLGLSIANVAIAVWRPRLGRRPVS